MPDNLITKANRQRDIRAKRKAEGRCVRCGSSENLTEKVKPNGSKVKTCSICLDKQRFSHKQKIEYHKRYELLYSQKLCTQCGNPNDSPPYNGKPAATCSLCRLKNRQRKYSNGGYTRYPEILKRDNFTCQLCGRTHRPHVHHIDGKGEGLPTNERNDHSDNLVTLCTYCHYAITCLRQNNVNLQKAIELLLA